MGVDDDFVVGLGGIKLSQCQLVRKRATGCGFSYDLDAAAAQGLLETLDTAFSATGTHPEPGSVLHLIHRDEFAVADGVQDLVEGDIVAMTDINRCGGSGSCRGDLFQEVSS